MKIQFTIEGNQDDPKGNPIPKIKKTFRQQWTPQAQRYAAWKEYVKECASPALIAAIVDFRNDYLLPKQKPIKGTPEAVMDIVIHWANERHADQESIFGSIADAIFENDKELAGSFSAVHDGQGKVEVTIELW